MDNTSNLQMVPSNTVEIVETPEAFQIQETVSTDKPFIQANTIGGSLEEIKTQHLIPVYTKDNERLISSAEFIEATHEILLDEFSSETVLPPAIRLSHPIKGRIPEAKDKPADHLEDWEKTIFYERMAFIFEIPTVYDIIDGNRVCLTVGGIKAYNLDNMYNRKGADEHFKIFIGFQNKVCLNMCVWSDGSMLDLRVNTIGQLKGCIRTLIHNYDKQYHLFHLRRLCDYSITEHQFAQLIGRTRMYQFLPNRMKKEIPQLLFGDTQISTVVRDYFSDKSFCRMEDGNLNLWRLYNLFTNANKSTYIDQFVERGVNAFSFTYNIKSALQNHQFNWYLS